MGNRIEVMSDGVHAPKTIPDTARPTTFDPKAGFVQERPMREMKATWEEMERANLPYAERDYCAHAMIAHKKCLHEAFPLGSHYCRELKHAYFQCQARDIHGRMMDFERERRLLRRLERKKALAEGNEQ